ncbi:MAG: hypothetical protein O3B13_13140 [Planctomycetota bacterium]|nr:hypothetical protein [Planctomycetota bacterium]MDA1164044.1 hypothetical protein [Planctomycetota bacterium]
MIRISKWLAGAAATVAILLGSTDAEAQFGPPRSGPSGRPDPSQMFEQMDANKDGALSKEEMQKFFAQRSGRPGGDGTRPASRQEPESRRPDGSRPEGRGPDGPRRPDGPPLTRGPGGPPHLKHDGHRPPQGYGADHGPNQRDSKGRKAKDGHKSRSAGKGHGPSTRRGHHGRDGRQRQHGRHSTQGWQRPLFSPHRSGSGGPPWMHRGPQRGQSFGQRPSFGRPGSGRPPMGPPWLHNRGSNNSHGPQSGHSMNRGPQRPDSKSGDSRGHSRGGPDNAGKSSGRSPSGRGGLPHGPSMNHRGPQLGHGPSHGPRGTENIRPQHSRPGQGRPDHGHPQPGSRPEGRNARPQGGPPHGPPNGGPRGERGNRDEQNEQQGETRSEDDRRPTRSEGDRPNAGRREASLSAELEESLKSVPEAAEVVEVAPADVVAETIEIDETLPFLVESAVDAAEVPAAETVTESLPVIVPGLAQPESPALPENTADNDSVETEVTADSATDSEPPVVATPVSAIAIPE